MWHASLSRREFTELCLGSFEPVRRKLQRVNRVLIEDVDAMVDAYWEREADAGYVLPSIIVTPDDVATLLLSVIVSPQAPSPLSSLCRILTREEAKSYFADDGLVLEHDVLPAVAALAMAEAILHADGRIGLQQLTPAVCKRTLSYAWGRALAARVPATSIERLPSRWLDTYQLINQASGLDSIRRTISASVGALEAAAQLGKGAQPACPAGKMAYALMAGSRDSKDTAWRALADFLDDPIPLTTLSAATREERGSYLQQALRISRSASSEDTSVAAACAFLATQVAPGSLEHLEVLRGLAEPSVLLWYALYAVLQSPKEILSSQGGLGFRLLRDIARTDDHFSRPTADLAFGELKALERVGLDSVSRKIGHAGELEVELVPFVTSSFTFHSKSRQGRMESSNQQLSLEEEQFSVPDQSVPTKIRINRLLSSLAMLVQELPDTKVEAAGGSSRKNRKTK